MYASANPAIATVDNDGNIKCVAVGTTAITASKEKTPTLDKVTTQYTLNIRSIYNFKKTYAKAVTYHNNANGHFSANRYEQAKESIDTAIKLVPEIVDLHEKKCRVYSFLAEKIRKKSGRKEFAKPTLTEHNIRIDSYQACKKALAMIKDSDEETYKRWTVWHYKRSTRLYEYPNAVMHEILGIYVNKVINWPADSRVKIHKLINAEKRKVVVPQLKFLIDYWQSRLNTIAYIKTNMYASYNRFREEYRYEELNRPTIITKYKHMVNKLE